jgi:hypothetical protein
MKPTCEACFRRLHPLGYGCPLGIHMLASPGRECEVNTHLLTDLELNNLRYFPERLEA